MYSICCTRKLLDRGGRQPLASYAVPTTVLGNWYANLVFARPEQVVVCISEKTLLPVIVRAKDFNRLPERIAFAAVAMLKAIGVSGNEIASELSEMQEAHFAKTADRRVVGCVNDFVFHVQHGTGSDLELSLHERALRLAHMPCGALEYAYPSEAALAAFVTSKALKVAQRAV